MTIQDILDKVAEQGISLWDLKGYNLKIFDARGKEIDIKNFKITEDTKEIKVRLK